MRKIRQSQGRRMARTRNKHRTREDRLDVPAALVVIGIVVLVGSFSNDRGWSLGKGGQEGGSTISCYRPFIIDGDTFSCGGVRIRLASIDAPEMPGHCATGRRCTEGDAFASKNHLRSLTRKTVTCHPLEIDHYGRTVAECTAGDVDIGCAMVAAGHAVVRYGYLSCP